MSKRTKHSTLTQDTFCILKNTFWDRKAEILFDFSLRMLLSGYSEFYQATIINSALTAWRSMKEYDEKEQSHCIENGDGSEWRETRRKKEKWYRRLGGEVNNYTVCCPMSPGSRLGSKRKEVVEQIRSSSVGLVRRYI